jgi:hypothetical protein
MSLVIVHLRWDDVEAEQYDQVRGAIPPGRGFPAGCCSRQLRLDGRALLGTEVWADDEAAARYLDELSERTGAARLEPPQIVLFSLPAPYDAAYRRAAELLADEQAATEATPMPAAPVLLPRPRVAAESEVVAPGTS